MASGARALCSPVEETASCSTSPRSHVRGIVVRRRWTWLGVSLAATWLLRPSSPCAARIPTETLTPFHRRPLRPSPTLQTSPNLRPDVKADVARIQDLTAQAEIASTSGRYTQALELYSQIVDAYPDLAVTEYARLHRALLLYEVGEIRRCLLELDDLEVSLRGLSEVHAALAAVLYVERPLQLERAEAQWDLATEFDGRYADVSWRNANRTAAEADVASEFGRAMAHLWELCPISAPLETTLQLVDVYIAEVEKQSASELIGLITLAHPLTELRHLRRIRSVSHEDGKRLEILLCLATRPIEDPPLLPPSVAVLVESFDLTPELAKVPGMPPPTVELWSDWCQYWAMPWKVTGSGAPTAATDRLKDRTQDHLTRLEELSQMTSSPNVAVIVDPISNRVIACGSHRADPQHPLRHAVMEVIASASEWEQDLTPSEEGPPEKRPKLEEAKTPPITQYLCTGFEIYCQKEPCLMCAMALVHSRFERVIFLESDAKDGAFTVHGLHYRKGLNHHYPVFQAKRVESGQNAPV